jgi:hypothetical protein
MVWARWRMTFRRAPEHPRSAVLVGDSGQDGVFRRAWWPMALLARTGTLKARIARLDAPRGTRPRGGPLISLSNVVPCPCHARPRARCPADRGGASWCHHEVALGIPRGGGDMRPPRWSPNPGCPRGQGTRGLAEEAPEMVMGGHALGGRARSAGMTIVTRLLSRMERSVSERRCAGER